MLLAGWSLFVLKRIFLDAAWPTFLPHLIILATVPLAAIQWRMARRERRDTDLRRERILLITGLTLLIISAKPLTLMALDAAMSSAVARRYTVQPPQGRDALRAEIGGHVVTLEDDEPLNPDGDVRIDGIVRIVIDGRDYSTNARAEIRLNSGDANRYWGYLSLKRLIDRAAGVQHLVVAQNLVDGRYRTLTIAADGRVVEDEFSYEERCNRHIRAILIDDVVPHPLEACANGMEGWAGLLNPVVYPWVSFALGLSLLADGVSSSVRRRHTAPVV